VSPKDILWDDAVLSLELPDMRAIMDRVTLTWGSAHSEFGPGKGTAGLFAGEIKAGVRGLRGRDDIPFALNLRLHGGGSITFLPLGGETTVRLKSPWKSPSFSGSYLPSSRSLSERGFEAEWKVISMARAYPQRWRQGEIEPSSVLGSGFGVDFIAPVDTCLKVTRALTYAALFLLLPFVTIFLLRGLLFSAAPPPALPSCRACQLPLLPAAALPVGAHRLRPRLRHRMRGILRSHHVLYDRGHAVHPERELVRHGIPTAPRREA
jgi:inner membrane protein